MKNTEAKKLRALLMRYDNLWATSNNASDVPRPDDRFYLNSDVPCTETPGRASYPLRVCESAARDFIRMIQLMHKFALENLMRPRKRPVKPTPKKRKK